MNTLVISFTEFSRNLTGWLNQVQDRGQSLDIKRGKRLVARVSPAPAVGGYPIAQLDALLIKGPHLNAADRETMVNDCCLQR